MSIKQGRRRQLASRILLAAGALLLIYVAWTAWRIWAFGGSTSPTADAAIVLGASTGNGTPSPAFEARILQAIELYRSGRVAKLIFTGGTAEDEPISLAEAAADCATQRGVPHSDILIEPYSQSTRGNLAFARQIAQAQGLTSFLIVSDPLHLRRAMRMAVDLGLQAWPSAALVPRNATSADRLRFLIRETRLYIQYLWVTRFIPPPTLEEAARKRAALKPPERP